LLWINHKKYIGKLNPRYNIQYNIQQNHCVTELIDSETNKKVVNITCSTNESLNVSKPYLQMARVDQLTNVEMSFGWSRKKEKPYS